MLNSQEPEGYGKESLKEKIQEYRPQTQQNYLGSKRMKFYFNKGTQENAELAL
jgi:hypothetical protein